MIIPDHGAQENRSNSRYKEAVKCLIASISFSNICFIAIWSDLLTYTPADSFMMKRDYPPYVYGAAVVNVLGLGVLIWLARYVIRLDSVWTRVAAGLAMLVPLQALWRVAATYCSSVVRVTAIQMWVRQGLRGMALVGACVLVFLCWRSGGAFFRRLTAVFLCWSPLVVYTFALSGWRAFSYDGRQFQDGPLAAHTGRPRPAMRVVWVIFDEWDQRLTFEGGNIALPELSAFRSESVYCSRALPPGRSTITSLPSLLTGSIVTETQPAGPGTLMLRKSDAPYATEFSREKTVFDRARETGAETSVVGWGIPYGRVLNRSLNACWWWGVSDGRNAIGDTFSQASAYQLRRLFETRQWSVFGQTVSAIEHRRTYEEIMRSAVRVASSAEYDFVLLHLPAPHGPFVYDPRTNSLTSTKAGPEGYLDSIGLVDRSLGELRAGMEASGAWYTSTILLTADHPYRDAEILDGKRSTTVPFLLKLAGQNDGRVFDRPFNTVITGDLLLQILDSHIHSPDEVITWLTRPLTTKLEKLK